MTRTDIDRCGQGLAKTYETLALRSCLRWIDKDYCVTVKNGQRDGVTLFPMSGPYGLRPVALTVVLLLTVAEAIVAVQPGDLLKHSARTIHSISNNVGSFGRGASNAGGQPSSGDEGLQAAFNYTALECSRYEITYSQIERDLEIHRKLGGVSLESTRYFSARYGGTAMRGATVGFFGGRAFLLSPTNASDLVGGLGHHGHLHVAYLRMLLHVEGYFGTAIPDVVFVLTTSDTPRYVSPLVVNSSSPRSEWPKYGSELVPGPYPVCGIGKSDFFPDLLLVPNFHFHMKLYDKALLSNLPKFDEMPWKERKPVLFGRFSISSRLEQLLPMGSLVFKQTSGYYAYYYRSLLKHRVNIIEFWRDRDGDGDGGGGPEDVFTELDWAAANDEAAAAIAAEGQRIAATYLTGNGRTCYWYSYFAMISYSEDAIVTVDPERVECSAHRNASRTTLWALFKKNSARPY
ncbi:hypothetical protein VOLCADRAFT_107032 [Volvox carteri f. nagariensis]|uniref:Glycosyl transferase CAP10 domain-containing protein n=1 Tax=Volvox carteri f. nagariensis TaxID=3068 RepID=D8UBF3_VOLCA|nr:uncharacterized protein VOLCADRAFT_107032 [Volvox carteri f. nagariensis]EFJ42937.1 hypothetical protein VOLCADRAFT_107032 [Volvox carteri f. nagariensis]|eukprot:XP_002955977.1 hypothetical protein VOLCADRAFT_107032 [Volvox carteri f. nagariensis]